jgi:hypothetical protein
MHDPRATLCRLKNLDFEVRAHVHTPTGLQLSAGMNHRFISVIAEWLEKQKLCWSARVACAEQSGVENARRIQHDRVARRNELREIAKLSMFYQPRLTMHDHQPALITPLGRYLCYLIGREMKVVVFGSASVSDQKREGCDPFDDPDGIVNPKCL